MAPKKNGLSDLELGKMVQSVATMSGQLGEVHQDVKNILKAQERTDSRLNEGTKHFARLDGELAKIKDEDIKSLHKRLSGKIGWKTLLTILSALSMLAGIVVALRECHP